MWPGCGNSEYNLGVLLQRPGFQHGAGKNQVPDFTVDADRAFSCLQIIGRVALSGGHPDGHEKEQQAFHFNVHSGREVSVT